jgi:hypothetical protein
VATQFSNFFYFIISEGNFFPFHAFFSRPFFLLSHNLCATASASFWILPGSRDGEKEEPHSRRWRYTQWRRHQSFIKHTE